MIPKPVYPIYIISKGRHDVCYTANCLLKYNVDFHLVIEPQEFELYNRYYDENIIDILPFSNLGQGGIPARNWVKDNATELGYKRHWILDDNIRKFYRRYKDKRIECDPNYAFVSAEIFTERYTNIAIAGLNYACFSIGQCAIPPFYLNHRVYSCLLILNELKQRWRGRYNEDTDLCLQVLSDSWCTVLINVFLIGKTATMKMKGGNSDELYKDNGRLKMAQSLIRMWPGVVKMTRRWGRLQHVVDWSIFTTKLIKRDDVIINAKVDELGMDFVERNAVKSKRLHELMASYRHDVATENTE